MGEGGETDRSHLSVKYYEIIIFRGKWGRPKYYIGLQGREGGARVKKTFKMDYVNVECSLNKFFVKQK